MFGGCLVLSRIRENTARPRGGQVEKLKMKGDRLPSVMRLQQQENDGRHQRARRQASASPAERRPTSTGNFDDFRRNFDAMSHADTGHNDYTEARKKNSDSR